MRQYVRSHRIIVRTGDPTIRSNTTPSDTTALSPDPSRPTPPRPQPPTTRTQMSHRPTTAIQPQPCTRTPNFASDGRRRPGNTRVRTAVSVFLLARRKPGVQIPSPPPSPDNQGNDGELLDVLVLRHGPLAPPRFAAPLLRAAPAGAEPLGAHRRQPLGEPRLAQAFLEGRAKQPEEATGPTWRTSWATSCAAHGRHPLMPARKPGPRPGTAHWAMSGPSRPPACTGTALRRTLLW
jgi:hypothetical protein